MEKIEKIDNLGRGITFIDGKIAFVKNALPGDTVTVKKIVDKKKYCLCKVEKYIEKSSLRKENKCEYSDNCGGCQFMNLTYEDSINLKVDSYEKFLKKNNILTEVDVIKCKENLYYRNKISLKISGGKIGFYEENSKKIVPIKKCMIASKEINEFMNQLIDKEIQNAFVTIRSNVDGEILLSVNTKEKIDFSDVKAAGIILNNELISGEKFFFDTINDIKYEVNYNSFFQVNNEVISKIINEIKNYADKEDVVLDLYSGVGTLSLGISENVKKIYGLEITKEAVINANNNALINNIENTKYKYADLSKCINFSKSYNTLIVDPPRNGIDGIVMNFIKKSLPEKIFYVSCDASTFIRDVKLLEEFYEIKKIMVADMFAFTYHLESVCILERK